MSIEVIIFIVVLVVYFVVSTAVRRYLDMKVLALYNAGLYDEALKTLDNVFARILMTTYRQYMLRFLVHEAQGDHEMATRIIELLLRMRNSKKRQGEVVSLAFNYYVSLGNKKRAKELMEQSRRYCEKSVADDCQLTYEIVFGKRCDYIDRMVGMLDNAQPQVKSKLYYLIAKQYRNAGDGANARKYEKLFDDLVKENAGPEASA